MARELNFNSLERPHLKLTMRDADHTVLRVTTPTEELVERLTACADGLQEVLEKKDADAARAAWDLLAELLSYNMEGIKVTANDLIVKYGLFLDDAVVLMKAYLDFITELTNAKN
jgi:hypothetical protein